MKKRVHKKTAWDDYDEFDVYEDRHEKHKEKKMKNALRSKRFDDWLNIEDDEE